MLWCLTSLADFYVVDCSLYFIFLFIWMKSSVDNHLKMEIY